MIKQVETTPLPPFMSGIDRLSAALTRVNVERLERDKMAQQQGQFDATEAINREQLARQAAAAQQAAERQGADEEMAHRKFEFEREKEAAAWADRYAAATPSQRRDMAPGGRLRGVDVDDGFDALRRPEDWSEVGEEAGPPRPMTDAEIARGTELELERRARDKALGRVTREHWMPWAPGGIGPIVQPRPLMQPRSPAPEPAPPAPAAEPMPDEAQRAQDRVALMFGKKPLGVIDGRNKDDEVRAAGEGLIGMARTPAEAAMLRRAVDQAAAASQYQPQDKALSDAAGMARFQIGEMGKDRRMQAGATAAGPRMDLQRLRLLEHFRNRHVVNASNKFRVGLQNDTIADADAMLNQLALDNPLAERAAFTKTLKAMFSSVTSNTELTYAQEAGGVQNRIDAEINVWFDQGRIPDNFRAWLQEVSLQSKQEAEAIKLKAADMAYQGVLSDNLVGQASGSIETQKQMADAAAQMILGGASAGEQPESNGSDAPGLGVTGRDGKKVNRVVEDEDEDNEVDADGLPVIDGVVYE